MRSIAELGVNHLPDTCSGGGAILQEILPSPERKFLFHVKAITITGLPGSGQSSTAETLAKILRVSIQYGGKEIRGLQSEQVVGFAQRPIAHDQSVDEKIADSIRNATTEQPVIVEAKLGAIIADEVSEENPDDRSKIISFFQTCPAKIRIRRVRDRQRTIAQVELMRVNKRLEDAAKQMQMSIGTENEEQAQDAYNDTLAEKNRRELEFRGLTTRYFRKRTNERPPLDREHWSLVHPQLKIINPFDAYARNLQGERLYPYHVSGAKKNPQEVAEEIIQILIEHGHIEEITNSPTTFPSQGNIYKAS